MATLLMRLGGRLYAVPTDELGVVDDPGTRQRSGRAPFLVRLGFAAWCEDVDSLIDDPVAFDGSEVASTGAPLTTAAVNALQATLVVVRRQETVHLLDGIDAGRHLLTIGDARTRKLNARSLQSPFLVGLSFAAAVADQDVLSNPTDAACVEL
ncbi:MAG: hypothetical protein EA356_06005 [Geminicoccaceae bacterium]|nr:MAG: hypothetical protein EA356_06005 [Geminicoccaceae bacterium]